MGSLADQSDGDGVGTDSESASRSGQVVAHSQHNHPLVQEIQDSIEAFLLSLDISTEAEQVCHCPCHCRSRMHACARANPPACAQARFTSVHAPLATTPNLAHAQHVAVRLYHESLARAKAQDACEQWWVAGSMQRPYKSPQDDACVQEPHWMGHAKWGADVRLHACTHA